MSQKINVSKSWLMRDMRTILFAWH